MEQMGEFWSSRSRRESNGSLSLERTFTDGGSSRSSSRASSVSVAINAGRRSGAMSSQTRKILQELERISTPVRDAQQMAIASRIWDPERHTDPGRTLVESRPSTSGSTFPSPSRPGRIVGPPLSAIHTPTRAEVLPKKAITSSHQSFHPYLDRQNRRHMSKRETKWKGGEAGGGKLKTKQNPSQYGISTNEMDEADVVPLVPLPISVDRLPQSGLLLDQQNATVKQDGPSLLTSLSLPVGSKKTKFSFSKPIPLTGTKRPRVISQGLRNLEGESNFHPDVKKFKNDNSEILGVVREESDSGSSSDDSFLPTEINGSAKCEKVVPGEKVSECTHSDDSVELLPTTNESTPASTFPSYKKGIKWKCPDCHFNNQIDEKQCSQCLRKKNAPVKEKACEKWTCKKCRLENDDEVECCICCNVKRGFDPASEKNTSDNDKAVSWNCSECFVTNSITVDSCVCCGNRRTVEKKQTKMSETTTWSCGACLVSNPVEAEACASCSALKPKTSISEETYKISGEKWICDTCFVPNKADARECVCCNAVKPGTVNSSCSVATSKNEGVSSTDFSKAFTSSGGWSCTSCFVRNSANQLTCHGCSVPKPKNVFLPVRFGFANGGDDTEKKEETVQSGVCKAPVFPILETGTKGETGNEKKVVRFAEPVATALSISSSLSPSIYSVPAFTSASSESTTATAEKTTPSATTTTPTPSLFGFSSSSGSGSGSELKLGLPPVSAQSTLLLNGGMHFQPPTTTAPTTTVTNTPAFAFGFAAENKTDAKSENSTPITDSKPLLKFTDVKQKIGSGAPKVSPGFSFGTMNSASGESNSGLKFALPAAGTENTLLVNGGMNFQPPTAVTTTTSTNAVPTFNFGVQLPTENKTESKNQSLTVTTTSVSKPLFQFGQAKSTDPQQKVDSGSSGVFGLSTSSSSLPTAATPAAPLFSFGQKSDAEKKKDELKIVSTAADGSFFGFGGNRSGLFSSSSVSTNAAMPPNNAGIIPTFGSKPPPTVTVTSTGPEFKSLAPSFSFGTKKPDVPAAPATFNFGTFNSTNQVTSVAASGGLTGGFQFGAPNTGGSGEAVSTVFNFTSAKPSVPASNGPTGQIFQMGTGTEAKTRTTLKARRKIARR